MAQISVKQKHLSPRTGRWLIRPALLGRRHERRETGQAAQAHFITPWTRQSKLPQRQVKTRSLLNDSSGKPVARLHAVLTITNQSASGIAIANLPHSRRVTTA
jgi:hypothetical protein